MRKIPTLFVRDAADRRRVLPVVTPGCEWVLAGEGVATRKYDGVCVMLDDAGWWARRQVRMGTRPPAGFMPLATDPITGRTVGWEPIEGSGFAGFWREAFEGDPRHDGVGGGYRHGTYELVGPRINNNPERVNGHRLIAHADATPLEGIELTFDGIRAHTLAAHAAHGMEGIVWRHPDGRMAKIKARDLTRP